MKESISSENRSKFKKVVIEKIQGLIEELKNSELNPVDKCIIEIYPSNNYDTYLTIDYERGTKI